MKNKKKINFDQYSNDYKHYINDSIDKFDKNLSYYHQSKIEITRCGTMWNWMMLAS